MNRNGGDNEILIYQTYWETGNENEEANCEREHEKEDFYKSFVLLEREQICRTDVKEVG